MKKETTSFIFIKAKTLLEEEKQKALKGGNSNIIITDDLG